MSIKQRRILFTGLVIGVSATLGAYLLPQTRDGIRQALTPPSAEGAAASSAEATNSFPAIAASPPSARTRVFLAPDDLVFLDQLRAKFKSAIQNKHSRIKAIEQLIAYLMQRYPDDWAERVQAFLEQLFPELAGELYEQFRHLLEYNDWLRLHREELLKMSPEDRRLALWNARRAAFGDDAAEIFAGELRNERIHASLATLDSAHGKTLVEKTAVLLDAVKQAYGDQAEIFIQNRQTELLNSFLDVASVQEELRAMPPAERSAALREVRSALGMDGAALDRWSELDRKRDQNWDQGQRYMQERNRIVAQYEGDEEARMLRQSQDRNFGAEEAETIRNEEQGGYFRYGHARRTGRE